MIGNRNWLVKPGCWNYFKLITPNWSSFTLQSVSVWWSGKRLQNSYCGFVFIPLPSSHSSEVQKCIILTARSAKLQLKNGEWWSCNFFTSSTCSKTAIYWTALKTLTRKGSLFSVVICEDWTPIHTFILCMRMHKHLSKAIFGSQQNTPVSWPVHTPCVWPQKGQVHSQSPHIFKVSTTIPDDFQEEEQEDWLWTTSKKNTSWRKASQQVKKKKLITRSDYLEESLNSYIKTKDYFPKVRIMLGCFSESI